MLPKWFLLNLKVVIKDETQTKEKPRKKSRTIIPSWFLTNLEKTSTKEKEISSTTNDIKFELQSKLRTLEIELNNKLFNRGQLSLLVDVFLEIQERHKYFNQITNNFLKTIDTCWHKYVNNDNRVNQNTD